MNLRSPLFALGLITTALLTACGGSSSDDGSVSAVDSSTAGETGASSETSVDDSGSSFDVGSSGDSATPSDGGGEDATVTDTGTAIDPEAPGPYSTTKSNPTVGGNGAHLIVPTGAAPASGWPAVVFAHGFLLKPTDYDVILDHVASHGFVVLSVDYPGSLFSIDHRNVRDAILAGRTALAGGTVTGAPKVDATKIAAAGHSLGGKGAIWAVSAEPKLAAGLAFDPVDGNPSPLGGMPSDSQPMLVPTETAKITQPMGFFGATQSRCAAPPTFPGAPSQACAPEMLDAAHFFGGTTASTQKYLWTVWDYGHMQFLDNSMCGTTCSSCVAGKSDPDARKKAVGGVAVAFLRKVLLSDASMQTWLDGAQKAKLVTDTLLWDGTTTRPACPM